jgi:hypothetical protein
MREAIVGLCSLKALVQEGLIELGAAGGEAVDHGKQCKHRWMQMNADGDWEVLGSKELS